MAANDAPLFASVPTDDGPNESQTADVANIIMSLQLAGAGSPDNASPPQSPTGPITHAQVQPHAGAKTVMNMPDLIVPTPANSSSSAMPQAGGMSTSSTVMHGAGMSTTSIASAGDDVYEPRRNLYVSNLRPEVDDRGLAKLFEQFGRVHSSKVMVDIHVGTSRGFGFVQFYDANDATVALQAMDGKEVDGNVLVVKVASERTRQPGELTSKIFIRNVPAKVGEQHVRELCSRFGQITTVAVRQDVQHGVVVDATGGISQVAYVTFKDIESAVRAAEALNNDKPWESVCKLPLLVKVLDSNQKRRDQRTPGDGRRSGESSTTSVPSMAGSLSATRVAIGPSMPFNGSPMQMAPQGMQQGQPMMWNGQPVMLVAAGNMQGMPMQGGMQQQGMQQQQQQPVFQMVPPQHGQQHGQQQPQQPVFAMAPMQGGMQMQQGQQQQQQHGQQQPFVFQMQPPQQQQQGGMQQGMQFIPVPQMTPQQQQQHRQQ